MMTHHKAILSTAWIFAVLNYLYCDLLGLMDAKYLRQFLTGTVNGIEFTEGFLLGASVLMEIPMAMVVLSRLLPYRSNRWANIVAGCVMSVVQVSSLFLGSGPTTYYLFFSVIEISSTVFIVWYAWKWTESLNG